VTSQLRNHTSEHTSEIFNYVQGVDLESDFLIFACAGLSQPNDTLAAEAAAAAAAATAAVDAAAAAAEGSVAGADVLVANPLIVEERGLDAAIVDESPGDRHHHHKHHKHHRHLLQTAQEWEAAAWAVSDSNMTDMCWQHSNS
jgi:hypothetical protein